MQRNLWNIITACNVLKNATLSQVFFCHFSIVFKVLPVHLNRSLWLVAFKFMHAFIHQMKDADFWPNSLRQHWYQQWFQMISYFHVEKDLNRNEHLNLNLVIIGKCSRSNYQIIILAIFIAIITSIITITKR